MRQEYSRKLDKDFEGGKARRPFYKTQFVICQSCAQGRVMGFHLRLKDWNTKWIVDASIIDEFLRDFKCAVEWIW